MAHNKKFAPMAIKSVRNKKKKKVKKIGAIKSNPTPRSY